MELQREKISTIEDQLRALEQEDARLQGDERTIQTQVAELSQMLLAHTGDTNERAHLESMKTGLSGSAMQQVQSAQSGLVKRKADLTSQLIKEKDVLQALSRKLSELVNTAL